MRMGPPYGRVLRSLLGLLLGCSLVAGWGPGTGRPGGALALFGNRPVGWEPALRADLDAIYTRHMPEEPWFMVRGKSTRPLGERIAASGGFRDLVVSVHPWTDRRSAEDYTRLLRTHSDHAALPAATREALLAEVRQAIEAHGGEITVQQEATLYVAFRAS